MKKLVLFLLFVISFSVKAQFKISGKVTDENGASISFVTVKIISGENKVNYTQTNSLGVYNFENFQAGKYTLRYSSLTFENATKIFSLATDTIINATLKLTSNKLSDVQIRSSKPLIERKIDRTVFNVENSVSAIGTDAMELLAKVPGVRVLNDKLSLVGKGLVNVMVNDKLVQLAEDDLSNYLKSISSDQIAKIEVITNPPAKYDAQGNNGLINIVLKKATADGFKGAINTVFTQASYLTASLGGNLNYRANKIAVNSSFNIRKGSIVPFEQSNIFYPNQTWNIVNKDRNFRTVPAGQIGLDYQPTKNALISVSYSGALTNFHSEENIKTSVYKQSQNLDSILNSDAKAKIRSHYHSSNLFFKQKLDSAGKQIVLNADWFTYSDDKSRFFNNTSYFNDGVVIPGSFAEYLSTSKQAITFYTLKADVDLPYKAFTLSFGSKLSFIKNQSDIAFFNRVNNHYVVDRGQLNIFNYAENTQAIYFNLSKSVKKWDFQLGLRGEYTQIDGVSLSEINKSDYFQLFPTAFVNYKLNDKQVFSVNYGRRINRPAYRKLNPFRWYSNQYAYTEGNPFLQPAFQNNIEISHIYKRILTSTFSFSNVVNGFNDVNFVETNTNIQVSKPINFIRGYHYQIGNAVVFNPFKNWQSINQLDVFYNISNSNIVATLNNLGGFGAYFSTGNQFTLNNGKTLFAEVNFWHQFANVDGLNNNQSQSNLDFGVKALLLKKKLQLSLNANDVLKTNRYRFNSLVNNIRQEYNNYYDSRQLRVTLRYNFGNEKIKQLDRKTGNEEERRRSN